MLSIEMLPVAHGDCLWIEYGAAPVRRVLIDGGPSHTYDALVDRIRSLPLDDRHFELLVVTHIDTDHINGIIRLLREEHVGCTFGEVWFNGWPQIAPDDLGAKQGEYLGCVIQDVEDTVGKTLWNTKFDGKAVRAGLEAELCGGLKIAVLGPTTERLTKLRDHWFDVLEEIDWKPGDRAEATARLAGIGNLKPVLTAADAAIVIEEAPDLPQVDTLGGPGDEGSDSSVANGSSISLLVQHGDKCALLVGDAFAADLAEAIEPRRTGAKRFEVNALKLPHHGSIRNLTTDFLEALSCQHYMVSTSGAQFKHPDGAAIDLILEKHDRDRGDPELHFNYLTDTTREWHDDPVGFVAHHDAGPLVLE